MLSEQLATARVIDLEQPRFAGMPTHPAHKPAYFYGLYRRHRDTYRPQTEGVRSGSSGVLTMMEHSGTHIDALCHQASDLVMHGNVRVEDVESFNGYSSLGIETVPPLLGRGLLLDIAAWKGVDRLPPGSAVSADEMQACAAAQGVAVQAGDVLLVRTGYGGFWDDEPVYMTCAGVAKSGSIWAAERGVRAVGADNLAWDTLHERDPDTGSTLFAHVHLLQRHGIYIMENMNLEALSAAKAFTFAFIGIPLKLRGATGSPIRPLALMG
jgi:kynurenine formamidase